MKFLSCGAGMQSTALALMSCENKMYGIRYPEVPIYDAILLCYEKSTDFCHRHIVSQWFFDELGVVLFEL